ncbi:hypothetical protein SynWH8101_1270 [Synechococcus sp. WH 8101]|nr:hypothetical protein SynWH8101_1270 [Synechococcus sp. WH 8101]
MVQVTIHTLFAFRSRQIRLSVEGDPFDGTGQHLGFWFRSVGARVFSPVSCRHRWRNQGAIPL